MCKKLVFKHWVFTLLISCLCILSGCEESKKTEINLPKSLEAGQQNGLAEALPSFNFRDVSQEMGISFVHENGAAGEKWFPETMLGGVGFFDYNNDGFADLVAVSGSSVPGRLTNKKNNIVLYRNDAGKGFHDVTEQMGLVFTGYGIGLTAGDYDGDGFNDLYITAYGKNRLLKNVEGKRFVDVTSEQGVEGLERDFSTAASFVDVDKDGDLDLFVGNYLDWSMDKDNEINVTFDGKQKMYPHPNLFKGTQSKIYINQYPKPFEERVLGGGDKLTKALGVLPADINGDSHVDLVVANDSIKNFAFINDGAGNFSEKADEMGLSYNNLGLPTAAMGIDGAWLAPTQKYHIAMGNFSNEMSSFYQYNDAGFYVDVSPLIGVGAPTRVAFTFGVVFADLDLDGNDEYIQVNGDVEPDINKIQNSLSYKQSPQVFWQCSGECVRQFMPLPNTHIGALDEPLAGRGIAVADIDHDGDLDFAISSIRESIRIYKNESVNSNHWIGFVLDAQGKNHEGIGAIISIEYQGRQQQKMMMPTKGYLSHSESVVYFGLGDKSIVDTVNIVWPNGGTQTLSNLDSNKRHVIHYNDK